MPHLDGHTLTHLLGAYGYWAVLFFVAVESTGIPVPGETMLLAASIYAGTTHRLSIALVILAAAAGAVLGDNLGYVAGRTGGIRLLQRYGRYVRLDQERLEVGRYLFQRHGGKVVFFGRFVPVLRIWAAFLAGSNAMAWRRFLLFNAAGGMLWAAAMGSLAFSLGHVMLRYGGIVGAGVGVAGTLAMIAATVATRRNERRLRHEAACWPSTIETVAA